MGENAKELIESMNRAYIDGEESIAIELLNSFDEYHKKVLETIQNYHQIEQANFDLKAENDNLLLENDDLKKILVERDIELEQMTKKMLNVVNTISSKLNVIGGEVELQKKIVNLQYDLEVAITSNRNLEKDLMIHKTENERLRTLNSQIKREYQQSRQPPFG